MNYKIDNLQYCNWSRETFELNRSAGLDAVHVTIVYHEDYNECLTETKKWQKLFKDNILNFRLALCGSIFFGLGSIFFAGVGLTPHDLYMEMHIFFALNAFRLMIPGSLLFLIVLYRSKVENYFAFTIFFLMISTFAYVLYQIYGGNPLENIDNLSQQATIQKLIVLVNILCVFIISFAFSNQYKILNQLKGL